MSKTKSREELVRYAHSAAASVFVGKKTITPAMLTRAKNFAFRVVSAEDRTAGTSHHPTVRTAADIAAVAYEGVDEVRLAWNRIWGRDARRR